jgi:hypothetical protein
MRLQIHGLPHSDIKGAIVAIIGIVTETKIDNTRLHPDALVLHYLETFDSLLCSLLFASHLKNLLYLRPWRACSPSNAMGMPSETGCGRDELAI